MKPKNLIGLTLTFALVVLAVSHERLVGAAPVAPPKQAVQPSRPAPVQATPPVKTVTQPTLDGAPHAGGSAKEKHPGGPKFDQMIEQAHQREQTDEEARAEQRSRIERELASAKARQEESSKASLERLPRLRERANAQQPKAPASKRAPALTRKASVSRSVRRKDSSGNHEFDVRLEASGWVDPRLIDYLQANLEISAYRQTPGRADEARVWREAAKPDESAYEISVELRAIAAGTDVKKFAWSWPSGFELVRPGVLRARAELAEGFAKTSGGTKTALRLEPIATTPKGLPKLGDDILKRAAGSFDTVELVVTCRASDSGTAMRPNPLRNVRVELGSASGTTNASGVVTLNGRFANTAQTVTIAYDDTVHSHSQRSNLRIMGEVPSDVRREAKSVSPRGSAGGKLLLNDVVLDSVDCETWRLGEIALSRYHELVGKSPPAGKLWIKRWSVDWGGTPYTFYDHVVLTERWTDKGSYRGETRRRGTMHHEFGHSVRHVADGDVHHWNWDNFRWVYAREHSGCEVFNTQYAFNEGWAGYWEDIAMGNTPGGCTGGPRDPAHGPEMSVAGQAALFVDWVENMVNDRLFQLSAELERGVCSGANARACAARKMVEVLERNPGAIHSMWDFEQRYCQLHHAGNRRCRSPGVPERAAPASCPPGYTDDGATCRLHQVIAKESYGRGAGELPTSCSVGKRYESGLCYTPCRAGHNGVAHLCWENCPGGYRDDGAFCAKPEPYGRGAGYPWQFGDGLNLDNANARCERDHGAGKCEVWGAIVYPKCRAGFHNAACCVCSPNCPSGMTDIGVSCAKRSYDRGVGTIPTACTAGKQYDAGLCYPQCRTGFQGTGPVCWGSCPAGFADQGALCSRPAAAAILVKY